MGVSGTGKTTIGKLLSKTLDVPFFDGDDFHPEANISKMASGKALNDNDRHDWLVALNYLLKSKEDSGAIVACSALKKSYRTILRNNLHRDLHFIFLDGSFELIQSRLEQRKGHFMTSQLLQSQFETLEVPQHAIIASIADTPTKIIEDILSQI